MKKIKKNKAKPFSIIILFGIIAINIYPIGCFSWGSPFAPKAPIRPPTLVTPVPLVKVDSELLLKALQCVTDNNIFDANDRQNAFTIRVNLEKAIKNSEKTFEISKEEKEYFAKKYPDCKFP